MSAKVLDGVSLSRRIKEECTLRVKELYRARGVWPALAVVIVGNEPAAEIYVRNKGRACEEVGIRVERYDLSRSSSETELLERIRALNAEPHIHGILVQLPLPAHICVDRILREIAPEKDVDGFHPFNVGLLATGQPQFIPCTPAGVIKLLAHAAIGLEGKHAVIVGRSNIVGKPMAMLLLQSNATVSICHSRTKDLAAITREADILVVATGRPATVTGSMVKHGAAVVDVGVHRLPEGRLIGDVEIASVVSRASHVTPVPGGVGPMTVAMLVHNTVAAAERIGRCH